MCYNAIMYESYLTLISQLMFQKSAHVSLEGKQIWIELLPSSFVLKTSLSRGEMNLVLESNGTELVTEKGTVWLKRTIPGKFSFLTYREAARDFLAQIDLYASIPLNA